MDQTKWTTFLTVGDEIAIDTPADSAFRFAQHEFHYAGPGAELTANARFRARKQFVVAQHSMSRVDETNSCPDSVRVLRQKLRDDGVLIESDGKLLFSADHAFNSPSLAAAVVYGGSVNGRSAWVDTDGRTINDLDKINLNQQVDVQGGTEEAIESAPGDNG